MSIGFMNSRKDGKHFDLARFAFKRMKNVNLSLKAKTEREYEQAVVSNLQASKRLRNNLITQVSEDEVEKIAASHLFGFKHRPDATIGNDGTAIEIKLISSGNNMRDILGQGLVYRIPYRFVILVIVDNTPNKAVLEACRKPSSIEYNFLSHLANELNIFSIVGPKAISSNIGFFPVISKGKIKNIEEVNEDELNDNAVDNDDIEEPLIKED